MQHPQLLDITSRAIRAKVCTQCYQRPPGSEKWEPTHTRPCEGQCPIFGNLPKLLGAVMSVHEPRLDAYEAEVRKHICQRCTLSPSAGEYCAEFATRTCPLSRYLGDIVEVLGKVAQLHAAHVIGK